MKYLSGILFCIGFIIFVVGYANLPDYTQGSSISDPTPMIALLMGLFVMITSMFIPYNPDDSKPKKDIAQDMVDMQNYLGVGGVFRCKYCNAKLPIFKMVLKFKSLKVGDEFKIRCKPCGEWNTFVKEFGKDQCKFCGKPIDSSKGNVCCKCFKKHVRVSEK